MKNERIILNLMTTATRLDAELEPRVTEVFRKLEKIIHNARIRPYDFGYRTSLRHLMWRRHSCLRVQAAFQPPDILKKDTGCLRQKSENKITFESSLRRK
jgi:hypothetical protein